MTNATVSFGGAVNGLDTTQANQRALHYQLFSGEVFTCFKEASATKGRHRVKTIKNGKSEGFGHIGRAAGKRHTPGEEIVGQKIKHAETVITIDDMVIADAFVASIDEAMASYDSRQPYAVELGDALARIYDKSVLRTVIQAARASNAITGEPGGTTVTLPNGYSADTDADQAIALADALFACAQTFMEKRSADPSQARAFITPANYYKLVRNKDLLNVDWGGLGSYAKGELPMVAGIPLVVTNHLPQQDDTAVVSGGVFDDDIDELDDKYAVDASLVEAVVFTPEAVGTLELINFKMEMTYDPRRLGTLMVAQQAVGHGKLRVECAIEIVDPGV